MARMVKSAEIFRKTVSFLAQQKGFSVRSLALKIGMDPSGFAKLLKGKNHPSLDTLDKIAEALEVSSFELLKPLDMASLTAIERRLAQVEAKLYSQPEDEKAHTLEDLEHCLAEAEEEFSTSEKKRDRKRDIG